MDFGWLKRMLPRGLYGRAALILLVPIITLQLVVSFAILQRYFEEVAQQMTRSAALDIGYVLAEYGADPGRAAPIADRLEILFVDPPAEPGDARAFYDLTGIEVTRVLRGAMPELLGIDLSTNWRRGLITARTDAGVVTLSIARTRLSASNPHQLLVLTVSTGFLMAAVAYIFLRNQLRPIRLLAEASDAFGKGRIEPYQPSGALEVRSAGRAFVDMRARIGQMIEQRTLMMSGVSHDLRTPLTRMKLGLSMQDPSPEIEALARDVEEMETLLNTFLDFARGDALDDPVLTDPVALASQIVDDAARLGRQVVLEVDGAAQPDTNAATPAAEGGEAVQIVLRPQAVHRALANLVSNALRYGNRALVTVALSDRALRFTVEDDGPGIPEDSREDAMRAFVRLDPSRNQDKGSGVGLGLAIAQDIARRHGGSLNLQDSTRLGGLRIDLVLPR